MENIKIQISGSIPLTVYELIGKLKREKDCSFNACVCEALQDLLIKYNKLPASE